MGLFSFLTGRKDEREPEAGAGTPSASPSASPDAASAPASPTSAAAPAGAAAEASTPDSTPPGPAAATPFTPPEAWGLDVGALTAPAPATTDAAAKIGPVDAGVTAELQGPIIEVIKTVYDPEIPVDIYELGLIYDIEADADRKVLVRMTLTSPACPSAQQIPSEVRYKVKSVPGVSDAWVDIVWDPPWDKDRMSEAARLALGIF
ncbi:MAG: DUF59 domain-containing protein [Vicinamibacterales bacterium]